MSQSAAPPLSGTVPVPAPVASRAQGVGYHLLLLVILVAIVVLGLAPRLTNHPHPAPQYALAGWLSTAVLLGFFVLVAGKEITHLWRGALIDERNKISLSRLQLLLWAILILSAFLTVALTNISGMYDSPLSISIPQELWVVMGISATSLVGSPLILSAKKQQTTNTAAMTKTLAQLDTQKPGTGGSTVAIGQVAVNTDPSDASWSDLFRGEETGNAAHLDMGKIQMFYFTIILLIAYGAALGNLFASHTIPIRQFPALDASFIALLAISHGGYLTNKAIPHTPEL